MVGVCLEPAERQVLELALERLDAEAVRERRVNVERLARDALLRLGRHVLEGAHVVEAIAELDEQDADVPRHRDHHLAEVLRLAVLAGREVDLRELGDAVDQLGDLDPELLGDVVARGERVLDDVVQQARADARRVEAEVRDDAGYAHRVHDVGLTGLSRLPRVHPEAVVVGSLDELRVDAGLVSPYAFDEVFGLEHARVAANVRDASRKSNTPDPMQQSDELDGLAVERGTRRAGPRAGVYVHFPWCLAKCPYCDFVSYATERPRIDHVADADAVVRELEQRAASVEARQVGSIFFGGGTPSLWEPAQLGRVIAAVRARLPCTSDLEVTVECNPTSIDAERASALVDVGVGRVSIGVQSLDDARLRHLGRLHDVGGGLAAVRAALSVVPRVSADLIFGLPGQSPEQARDEAVALVGLGLRHVSCYQLTIEPGTRFGDLAKRGRLPLADDGMVAEAFLAIDEALGARGFEHYEVSSYAMPGQQARHNVSTWHGEEYLGLGCAAVGFVLDESGDRGVRYRNEPLPDKYLAGTGATVEPLDAATLLRERIMLGLRLRAGFDLERAARPLGVPGWTAERERAAAWLEGRGRIAREGTAVRIPPGSAWLWADDTAARLF